MSAIIPPAQLIKAKKDVDFLIEVDFLVENAPWNNDDASRKAMADLRYIYSNTEVGQIPFPYFKFKLDENQNPIHEATRRAQIPADQLRKSVVIAAGAELNDQGVLTGENLKAFNRLVYGSDTIPTNVSEENKGIDVINAATLDYDGFTQMSDEIKEKYGASPLEWRVFEYILHMEKKYPVATRPKGEAPPFRCTPMEVEAFKRVMSNKKLWPDEAPKPGVAENKRPDAQAPGVALVDPAHYPNLPATNVIGGAQPGGGSAREPNNRTNPGNRSVNR